MTHAAVRAVVWTFVAVLLSPLPQRFHLHAQTGTPLAAASPTSGDAALDSLAADAARLTARFADRRVAASNGYRRVGPDFPGMGEHWLNSGALLEEVLDPARPTILTYATIAGRPTLLGVAFVVTTQADQANQGVRVVENIDVPGWPHAWHEHSGLLGDESGSGGKSDNNPIPGVGHRVRTRVWVLHAWTALENPNGPYAPDNWVLPFARAGLVAPAGVDADAGRAGSLIVGGDAYLRAVLADAGLLNDVRAHVADSVIAIARAEVGAIIDNARSAGIVASPDAGALRVAWDSLDASLTEQLGPGVIPFLAPPHAPSRRSANGHEPGHHTPHR